MGGQQQHFHSSKPHFSQVIPQAASTQGYGQCRLSRAPSSSHADCTETVSVPDAQDHKVASRCRGNSIGPSNLNRWHLQKPSEESWTHISRVSKLHHESKNDVVIADAFHHLHISESERHTHGVTNNKTGRSGGGVNRQSSNETSHRSSNVPSGGKKDGISYADAARGPSAPRVKAGQRAFGTDGIPYFACFCCKRRALFARANGRTLPPTVKDCQCVQHERPVRRSLPSRHIFSNPRREYGEISQLQHDDLNGPAYKRARDAAKALGLKDRARDIFLWKEGFVTLHPRYAKVKHLLDPFAYWDDRLDAQTIRQIEADLQPAPRPPNAVAQSPSGSYAQVVAGGGTGNQPSTTGARAESRGSSRVLNTVQDDSRRGNVVEISQQFHAAPIFPRHGPQPQPQATEAPRHAHTVHSNNRHAPVPHHQITEAWHLPQTPQPTSRHGPVMQPPLRRESGQSNPPQMPFSRHEVPSGWSTQQTMEDFAFLQGGTESHYSQTVDWETPAVPGYPQHPISFPSTGQRTRSSQMQSTPGLTHGVGSTNTGYTSFSVPRTPRDPESPTPYSRLNDPVIEDLMRYPPGTVDPKMLERIPEMTMELEGMSRPLKRTRDKHDDRGR